MLPCRHWQARFIACIYEGGIGLSFKKNGLVLPMSARLRSIIMVTAAISLPAGPLLAQARPAPPVARPAAPLARPATIQPGPAVPANPGATAQPEAVPAPVPAPLPPAMWDALN